MAGRKAKKGGVGKAAVAYGNQDVISAAKSTSVSKSPIYKEVGGVVGKSHGGRLDKRARGGGTKSPFSMAGKKGG